MSAIREGWRNIKFEFIPFIEIVMCGIIYIVLICIRIWFKNFATGTCSRYGDIRRTGTVCGRCGGIRKSLNRKIINRKETAQTNLFTVLWRHVIFCFTKACTKQTLVKHNFYQFIFYLCIKDNNESKKIEVKTYYKLINSFFLTVNCFR